MITSEHTAALLFNEPFADMVELRRDENSPTVLSVYADRVLVGYVAPTGDGKGTWHAMLNSPWSAVIVAPDRTTAARCAVRHYNALVVGTAYNCLEQP